MDTRPTVPRPKATRRNGLLGGAAALGAGVRLWDVSTGENVAVLDESGFESVTFSPDGVHVAAGGAFTGVRVWDATSGELRSSMLDRGVAGVAFSPDSTLPAASVIVGDHSETLVWEAPGFQQKYQLVNGNHMRRAHFLGNGGLIATWGQRKLANEYTAACGTRRPANPWTRSPTCRSLQPWPSAPTER